MNWIDACLNFKIDKIYLFDMVLECIPFWHE